VLQRGVGLTEICRSLTYHEKYLNDGIAPESETGRLAGQTSQSRKTVEAWDLMGVDNLFPFHNENRVPVNKFLTGNDSLDTGYQWGVHVGIYGRASWVLP
jgi:hypothetical protein